MTTNLEFLLFIAAHTNSIAISVLIEEIFQLLLEVWRLLTEAFLQMTRRLRLCVVKWAEGGRTAYMLLSNCPLGSWTSERRRSFVLVSSISSWSLVLSASTIHGVPKVLNSLIRLNDATVSIGTQ